MHHKIIILCVYDKKYATLLASNQGFYSFWDNTDQSAACSLSCPTEGHHFVAATVRPVLVLS